MAEERQRVGKLIDTVNDIALFFVPVKDLP